MTLFPGNTLFVKWTLAICSLYLFSACGEPKTETVHEAAPTPPVDTVAPKKTDTVDFAVIPFDTSHATITGFSKKLQPASLSDADVQAIDSLMSGYITSYNETEAAKERKDSKRVLKKEKAELTSPIQLKDYKKQYLAVINAKGEKEVWANYFCKAIEERIEFVDWKKIPVKVIDGGNCFFNLRLNLSTRKAYDLKINSIG